MSSSNGKGAAHCEVAGFLLVILLLLYRLMCQQIIGKSFRFIDENADLALLQHRQW